MKLSSFLTLRFYFVLVSLTLVWVSLKYFQFERQLKFQEKKLKDLENQNIIKDLKINQCENIIEEVKKINPKIFENAKSKVNEKIGILQFRKRLGGDKTNL